MPSELQRLVRYCHPAKLLATTRLPGLDALDDAVLARLYGAPVDEYRRHARALDEQARRAAQASGWPRLPLRAGDRVLAVGDSHTDDLASWAEILRHVTGGEGIDVVNAGVSGDTTTALLARVSALPPAALAFALIGTNDARRHAGAPMLVSDAESRRNLRAIDAILRRRARRVVWITPPPVDERRMAADPALRAAGVGWRLADVERKAALVRELPGEVVDLWPAFGADDLATDGLHPSAAGQAAILRAALGVAAKPRRSSRPATIG